MKRFFISLGIAVLGLLLGSCSRGPNAGVEIASGGADSLSAVLSPAMATDGSHWYIVWEDRKTRGIWLRRSQSAASSEGTPIDVTATLRTPGVEGPAAALAGKLPSTSPVIAVFPKGNSSRVYVAWQELLFPQNLEIYLSYAELAQETLQFKKPINVSSNSGASGRSLLFGKEDGATDGNLDLAIGPAGQVYVVWTEGQKGLLFRRSLDGGATFPVSRRLPVGDTAPRFPKLAVDGQGNLYVAWADASVESGDIFLIKSSDGGETWSEPLNLSNSKGFSDAPSIAFGGPDTVLVVYDDTTDDPLGHVNIARSTDGGRTFSAPKEISAPKHGGYPKIARDAEGRLVVAFMEVQAGGTQRSLAFTISTDGGLSFSSPQTIPGTDLPAITKVLSEAGRPFQLAFVKSKEFAIVWNGLFAEPGNSKTPSSKIFFTRWSPN
ncbi:exo-alpha-sialidase [Candidatus Acetothermia bacterium]|nr:exo-alpha-sialidase [Candidatus Acetothermia bacterium]